MEENIKPNFEDILSEISKVTDSYTTTVTIPSNSDTVIIKEINANQQKELLTSALDNTVYNTVFIKTFYKILEELLGENKLKVYTVFDKSFLMLVLRNQISHVLKVKPSETSDFIEVSLPPILEKFKTDYKHPAAEDVSEHPDLKVFLKPPTIYTEYRYETEMHKKEKPLTDIKNTNDIKDVISKEFLGEISKYIDAVHIPNSKIDFNLLSFPERVKIVERLSGNTIQNALNLISKWKSNFDEILTVSPENKDKIVIKTDPLLFVN